MGKKKSKVARVKQAKAKKSNAGSKFGASTMKPNKFSQQVTNHKLSLDGKGKVTAIQASALSKELQKPKPNKVFLSHSPLLGESANKKNDDEKQDFQRQKKSELLKEGGVVSTLIQSFQPASFSVEKSTPDLLQETVNQMQGMTGVGQAPPSLDSLPTPIRSNQSWAAVREAPMCSNPFAALALEEGDTDNESTDAVAREISPPTIQLAPASFILLPRTTPTPATTPLREGRRSSGSVIPALSSVSFMPGADGDDDDVDPDL
jgi:hypothetical protein